MKVALLTQANGINNIKNNPKPQMVSLTAPMKNDSVSFCGSKVNLVEDVVSALKSAVDIHWNENPSIGKAILDLDDPIFSHKALRFIFKEKEKSKSLFSFEKVKTYVINKKGLHSDNFIGEQVISKEEFDNVMNKIRENIIPNLLKQHGLPQPKLTTLLRDLAVGLIDGSAEIKDGFLKFKDKNCLVSLNHNSKRITLSGNKNNSNITNVIKLQRTEETKLANKIKKIEIHLNNRAKLKAKATFISNNFETAQAEFTKAQEKRNQFKIEQGVENNEIDTNLALILSSLKT